MKRGEIWTVSGGPDYAGKPRPAVILQDERFDATASITICPFTTAATEAPLFRLRVEPNIRNGLDATSRIMADKITTVPKGKVGTRLGTLDDEDIVRLDRAAITFLGLEVPLYERKWKPRFNTRGSRVFMTGESAGPNGAMPTFRAAPVRL